MSVAELAGFLGLILSGITLITQFIAIGVYLGKLEGFKTLVNFRFESLETKQDKHNNLIERMVHVEDSTKSAHKRLDSIMGA